MLQQSEKTSMSPAVADKAVVAKPKLDWQRPELREAPLRDLTMTNNITPDGPPDN